MGPKKKRNLVKSYCLAVYFKPLSPFLLQGTFRIKIIALASTLFLLYVGLEVSYGGFILTYAVKVRGASVTDLVAKQEMNDLKPILRVFRL